MVELKLDKPKIDSRVVGAVDWMEDVGKTVVGLNLRSGVLTKVEYLRGYETGDNADSFYIEICSTHPNCKTCSEREICLASNYKKVE